MLKEAPKLHVVMDNWLSIIKDARAICTLSGGVQIPVVLGGHHAHSVDFRSCLLLANMERVRGASLLQSRHHEAVVLAHAIQCAAARLAAPLAGMHRPDLRGEQGVLAFRIAQREA